ncbi:MAG TPA: T9SS type A sorting domain-containing protein [Candidatus Acidoferrales bacterium]|nr:T9SS type A sorting domain-containing protein [Candidatus Acidoferrales bacterium]
MPRPRSRAVVFAFASLGAALAALLLPAAARAFWSTNPNSALSICNAARQQQYPSACTDGANGMLVTWEDHRDTLTTGVDIFAQRIGPDGTVGAGWPVNGVAVCSLAGEQTNPVLVSDGAGGAIIAWRDLRGATPAIYADHLLGTGALDPAWPTNGRLVCNAANGRGNPFLISDGAGGAIISWTDERDSVSGSQDIYIHHVQASGAVDPAWPANGLLVCNAAGFKYFYGTLVSDGSGGALITWGDYRSNTSWDIYASHVLPTGSIDPAVTANGTAVCTLASDQIYPSICSDGGTGGAYVAWTDYRAGDNNARVYATRLKHTGVLFVTWPANGLEVCPGPASFQYLPYLAADGASGAIVAWDDYRSSGAGQVFAQHLLSTAAVDAAWPPNGVPMSTSTLSDNVDAIISDGAGGAFITWQLYTVADEFTPDNLYAGHLLSTGAVDPAWPAAGRALDTTNGNEFFTQIVLDGEGGVEIAWEHGHVNGLFTDDIDGTRLAYNGLEAPEPTIASVDDVPDDQGGQVVVRWNASWTDTLPTLPVASYTLWERLTGTAAAGAIERGASVLDARATGAARAAPGPGTLRVTGSTSAPIYWEYLASVPARAFTGYACQVATNADSTEGGIPWDVFFVDAQLKSGALYYSSGQDSGYSVDNLPPAMPAPFTATYSAGTAYLHWQPNRESDLAGYRLYRGSSPSFTPGPSNLVVAQSDTGYTDVAGGAYDYKLSAVDIHGNESPYAFAQPAGTTGVPTAPARFALEPVGPNPIRGDALVVRFSLPEPSPARLELFDVNGRRAALREVGDLGPGAHTVDLSAGGAFAPGLYLVRLTQRGRIQSRRVAVLE